MVVKSDYRSVSTMSYADEHDNYGYSSRPPVRYENTYQLEPSKKFPQREVRHILQDTLDSYLAEEKYEPELCKQMTKTLSEVLVLVFPFYSCTWV